MITVRLRETVARQLRQSQAHAGLRVALEDFPIERAGQKVDGHVHTAWQQVEHMRLAADDLVAYCKDAEYQALVWPSGYWPESSGPPSTKAWSASSRGILDATEQMARMVEDPDLDLYAKAPSAVKVQHHMLRAALILLDHNGYHTGQLIALRRALEAWSGNLSHD